MDDLEELGNGCLKRHEMYLGIVIIPVVMQPDLFKRFVKVTDIYFFIPAGYIPKWPTNMHEDLTVDLYFPFSDTNPGTGLKSSSWVYLEAHCHRCTPLTWKGGGIFCANLGVPIIVFKLCHQD